MEKQRRKRTSGIVIRVTVSDQPIDVDAWAEAYVRAYLEAIRRDPSALTIENGMPDRAWIVPVKGVGHEHRVDAQERERLLGDGYGEFRALCASGESAGQEVHLYVEGWPRDDVTSQLARGAALLMPGCQSMQVFRPDGSSVLP